MDTGFCHPIGSISSDVIGWWYKAYQSSFVVGLRTNKITPQGNIRSRMRASYPSGGSPTGDVCSDIPQLSVAHARTHIFKGNPLRCDVTFNDVTSGETPTREDIVQLPAAHAHISPSWSRDIWSLAVAMVLVLRFVLLLE
jgi:hypothetical protein